MLAFRGLLTSGQHIPIFTPVGISADPGDAAFTAVYSGAKVDEGSVNVAVPFSFLFQGQSFNEVGVSSNSYLVFGQTGNTFTFPLYSYNPASPPHPGFGICATPGSTSDTAYTFVGYRSISATQFQIRWKGIWPYSGTTINRIWDITFTKDSNVILIEMRAITGAHDTSGSGSVIVAKSASVFLSQSGIPVNGNAFSVSC